MGVIDVINLLSLIMFRRALTMACLLLALAAAADSDCAACHPKETARWQQSHHHAAMAVATSKAVLATADDWITDKTGTRFRLLNASDGFNAEVVESDAPAAQFPVTHTFGVYPLQQYLVDIGGGRLQALPVAWDARPEAEGGQRWFALDSDLNWRSFGFNWNTSCADCHSTGLRKNYSPASNTFNTTWSAINVSCAACHRGIAEHHNWLGRGSPDSAANAGFNQPLPRRGRWEFTAGQSIAHRSDTGVDKPAHSDQLALCADCHAHRTLYKPQATAAAAGHLADRMQLSLLEPGLYHADGQIDAEVYVTGSFLQSKMYAAGVVCSDCHEPHSQALRSDGNGVCLQCHRADRFATRSHHRHNPDNAGGACVNCHMPATVYMGVDARRDHRFGIPDPKLNLTHGLPNACENCHGEKEDDALADAFRKLFPAHRSDHYASVIAAADAGQADSLPDLAALARDPSLAPIKRASAQLRLANTASPKSYETSIANLQDTDPLLRIAALRSLAGYPLAQIYPLIEPLLEDPVLGVRIEAAYQLEALLSKATGLPALTSAQRGQLMRAVEARREQLRFNADHPASQMNLGISYETEGRVDDAQQAYLQALRIDPGYIPAMLNLAELQRRRGDSTAAGTLLARAVQAGPDIADAHFALGLHQIRAKDYAAALKSLERAFALAPDNARYGYTLAVAQEQTGALDAALTTLRSALKSQPQNVELLGLMTRYLLRAGQADRARIYLGRWRALAPTDPAIAGVDRYLQNK